ncbi:MAG TPA: respiratory nitrate reductase subunit gamma [Casimicrobiaceae bacterium]|nr:respiratory nitrate reductase subunit gamma [Casimicrobiaceae bacterium]
MEPSYLQWLLFGVYPYVALAVFVVGSIVRFDREQYTWKSDSSQLLRRSQLRWGSNLFHIGIIGIFFGHLVGLLTPLAVWHAIGLSAPAKQMLAMVAGGAAGLACLAGLVLLTHRRITDPRIRATSRTSDMVVLVLLLAQLVLGLFSITISAQHRDGGEMLKLMAYVQSIVLFRPGAAALVADVHPVFRAHLLLGFTLFLIFPFTRLVHIWSGFATLYYLVRPYQVVRSR